ncbi:MAG: energy transducer TonB [Bacteroidia bacterium]
MLPSTRISWIIFTAAAMSLAGSLAWTDAISSMQLDYAHETDEVDLPPYIQNREEIAHMIGYPALAWDSGIEGTVVLRILVDETGGYLTHEVTGNSHPLLQIPCEHFAHFLFFSPARTNGQPVKCWVEIPFEFEIP